MFYTYALNMETKQRFEKQAKQQGTADAVSFRGNPVRSQDGVEKKAAANNQEATDLNKELSRRNTSPVAQQTAEGNSEANTPTNPTPTNPSEEGTPAQDLNDKTPEVNPETQPTFEESKNNALNTIISDKSTKIRANKKNLNIGKVGVVASFIFASLAVSAIFLGFLYALSPVVLTGIILSCVFLAALVGSSAYSLSKSSDIDMNNCQVFISEKLKHNTLDNIQKLEDEQDKSNLIKIFKIYLGGSIPLKAKYLAKYNKAVSKKASAREGSEEAIEISRQIISYYFAIMKDFLEILDFSKQQPHHEEVQCYNDYIKQSLTKDTTGDIMVEFEGKQYDNKNDPEMVANLLIAIK